MRAVNIIAMREVKRVKGKGKMVDIVQNILQNKDEENFLHLILILTILNLKLPSMPQGVNRVEHKTFLKVLVPDTMLEKRGRREERRDEDFPHQVHDHIHHVEDFQVGHGVILLVLLLVEDLVVVHLVRLLVLRGRHLDEDLHLGVEAEDEHDLVVVVVVVGLADEDFLLSRAINNICLLRRMIQVYSNSHPMK